MARTFVLLLAWVALANGWKLCSVEDGGGVCPTGNRCCGTTSTPGVSSCITEPIHAHNGTGVCCSDDTTGCGPGYECATAAEGDGATRYFCRLYAPPTNDPAPAVLPRYNLCTMSKESLQLQALTVAETGPKFAYFSSMGSLEDDNMHKLDQHRTTTHVFIVIHGSGRNAEDYFCSATASVPSELVNTTMVIAPWFLAPKDEVPDTPDELLRWNETGPIPHTWRYGAEATDGVTSSYQALEIMVETIMLDEYRFPNLCEIIVAGHSAGGQFTHRWALTSSAKFWGDSKDANNRLVPLRVVAANPRSFCYLDARRYNRIGKLVKPEPHRIEKCPGYNGWEWGFEMNGRVSLPHHVKKEIEDHDGDVSWLLKAYSKRDVVYLAGSLDILPVYSECEDDDFQGKNRFERSLLYFNSLQELYGSPTHQRQIADGVPHDHCLIFQSKAGQEALFGDFQRVDGASFQAPQDGGIDH